MHGMGWDVKRLTCIAMGLITQHMYIVHILLFRVISGNQTSKCDGEDSLYRELYICEGSGLKSGKYISQKT